MSRFQITAIIAGILLLSVFTAPGWADPVLSVVPVAGSTVPVGGSIHYDISIANVADLFAFQFDVSFDQTVVSALSIVEGPFLPMGGGTNFFQGFIDNAGGTVTLNADSLSGPVPGVNGSGILAILTLHGVGGGTSSIGLANVTLLDSSLNPINSTTQQGSVTVLSTAVPEPSSALLLLAGASTLFFFVLIPRRLRLLQTCPRCFLLVAALTKRRVLLECHIDCLRQGQCAG